MHRIWKYQDYVDRLSHSSKYVRRWAFSGLTEQFPRRFAPEVAQLLDDPDDRQGNKAPEYLARHGAAEFAPAILKCFLKTSGTRAANCLKALGMLEYEPAFEAVVEKLVTFRPLDTDMFSGITRYLGYIRTEDSRTLLRRMLTELEDLPDTAFSGIAANLAHHEAPSDLAIILDAVLERKPDSFEMQSVFREIMYVIGACGVFNDFNTHEGLKIIENPAHALDKLSEHHPALHVDSDARTELVERLEKGHYHDLTTALLFEVKNILGKRYDETNIPDFLASSYKKDLMAAAFLEHTANNYQKWRHDPARDDETRCLITAVVAAWLAV
ncbi:MAG: hypothetical protein GY859_04535 [Desulfobacterales bacterium]|nr:hypothetical protein [Desulfobacterales bacterium]